MIRRAVWMVLALLAGMVPAGAATPAFLYIATGPPYTKHPAVSRFRLSNGAPASSPDRVYAGVGGQIALSGDGTLYAQAQGGKPGELAVAAFERGARKPGRTIVLAPAPTCATTRVIDALATDANGDLAVAVDAGRVAHGANARCWGIFVFAPDATGHARPLNTIALPLDEFGLGGGGGGDGSKLFATAYAAGSLFIYDDATHARAPSGVLGNPYPLTVVRNDGDLDVFDNAVGSARVYVFGRAATVPRYMLLQRQQVLVPAIAVYGNSIYIVENLLHKVFLYPKDGNGPVNPTAEYPTLRDVTDIAIGQ